MSDDRPEDEAATREQLHEKLGQTGELDAGEVELLIELGDPVDADLDPEALFTDSVMMTFSRSGKTGALPIALAREDDEEDEDLRPYDPAGPRLAIAHLQNGLVVRGLVADVAVGAPEYELQDSGGGGKTRRLRPAQIRTLHLMLPADMAHPPASGPSARVTLRNGATLEGLLPDHDRAAESFFLLPRGEKFMERILIFRHAVADLTMD